LFFTAVVYGQSFSYQGNVTISNAQQFSFRATSVLNINLPLIYEGTYFTSISLGIGPNAVTTDGVFGVSVFPAGVTPLSPAVLLTYFASSLEYVENAADIASFNLTNAGSFIGKVFLSLEEVNSTGGVVQTIFLKDLTWALVNGATVVGSGGLRYVTYTGTQLANPNFSVTISTIYSNVLGTLSIVGTPVVTPKSVESVINITSFPYISTADSVRLTIAVATSTGFVVASGSVTTLTYGSGTTAAYFVLSRVAGVNGASAPVVISGFTAGTADANFANSYITAQVSAKYGTAASLQFVTVTFPAGATSITYDPAVGAGALPPTPAGGMQVTASIFLSLIAFAFLLL